MNVGNLVFQTATTTGTGDFTTVHVTGYRDLSTVFGTGSTNKFYYFIRHTTADEFEVGEGYMSGANTLVRETVIESSNANAAVNFSAGTKHVACDMPSIIQKTRIDYVLGQVFS